MCCVNELVECLGDFNIYVSIFVDLLVFMKGTSSSSSKLY